MRDWRQIPLQSKVSLAMFLISSGVLTVALAVILAFQIAALRDAFERDLDTVANIAAVNCADAVASGDEATVAAELASLRKLPHFHAAWITTPDDTRFARVEAAAPPAQRPARLVARTAPVRLEGRLIGELWVEGDYGEARGDLVAFFVKMALAVFAVCVVAGWLLTRRAQHAILRPVLELASAAERVVRERDLSLRVGDAGDDEIGLLTRRFNEMLAQIETQDRRLMDARRDLESKVVALEYEIAERRRIEAGLAEVALREEQRIANDLHDGLGQMLTGIAFKADLLKTLLEQSDPAHAKLAAQVVELANESIQQASDIAHGVAPVDSSETGLESALAQLGVQVGRLTGARCAVHTNADIPIVPPEISIEIYRICQEAVHNAARHGRATEVDILLKETGPAWKLEIRDNGCGLPPAHERRDGLGLRSMAHRAGRVGGTIEFVPNLRGGLTVRGSFPIVHGEPLAKTTGAVPGG
jgi:signal transduction histidine kinase